MTIVLDACTEQHDERVPACLLRRRRWQAMGAIEQSLRHR